KIATTYSSGKIAKMLTAMASSRRDRGEHLRDLPAAVRGLGVAESARYADRLEPAVLRYRHRQLRAHPHGSAEPVPAVVPEHAAHRGRDRAGDRVHRRLRGICLLAYAVHRPPCGAGHDRGRADVPAAAGRGRDL